MLFRRKPADDVMFEFQSEVIPPIPPLRVCKACKEGISQRLGHLKQLMDVTERKGLTDVVARDFVESVLNDHDHQVIALVLTFVAGIALQRFSKPVRSANKLIAGFLRGSYETLTRVEKAIIEEASDANCQWHNGPVDEGLAEDQGDQEGRFPPGSDVSMFG